MSESEVCRRQILTSTDGPRLTEAAYSTPRWLATALPKCRQLPIPSSRTALTVHLHRLLIAQVLSDRHSVTCEIHVEDSRHCTCCAAANCSEYISNSSTGKVSSYCLWPSCYQHLLLVTYTYYVCDHVVASIWSCRHTHIMSATMSSPAFDIVTIQIYVYGHLVTSIWSC